MLLAFKISVTFLFILTGGNFFSKYIDETIENNKIALSVKTLAFMVAFLGSLFFIKDWVHDVKVGLIEEIKAEETEDKKIKPVPTPVPIEESILMVRSNVEEAQIWINNEDQDRGTTPLNLKLTAGNYDLVIKKVGYIDYKIKVYLKAGENKLIQGELKKQKAILTVRSNVEQAQVWINNENQGITPLNLKLKAGDYSLVIKKAGYFDYKSLVYLRAAENKLIRGKLIKGQVIGQYMIYPNGTVKDTKTNLIWKRCAEGLSGDDCQQGEAKKMSYQAALDYAEKIEGWRMPTIKELNTLVYCSNGVEREFFNNSYNTKTDCRGKDHKDNSYQIPTINQQVFPNTTPNANKNDWRSYVYWSSSPHVNSRSYAWSVYFYNGNDNFYKRSSERFVRLVRVGQ